MLGIVTEKELKWLYSIPIKEISVPKYYILIMGNHGETNNDKLIINRNHITTCQASLTGCRISAIRTTMSETSNTLHNCLHVYSITQKMKNTCSMSL